MSDKPEDEFDAEAQDILGALNDDLPDDEDLELMENGLAPDGSWMSTGDRMYDGSNWDPDRPPRSQIPGRDWIGP